MRLPDQFRWPLGAVSHDDTYPPPSAPLAYLSCHDYQRLQGAVCYTSTDDTPILSEMFRKALGYDMADVTSLERLCDFVDFMVHPDDRAWFSSGISSVPAACPPVGNHRLKQVRLRSKAGDYFVAALDARVHLDTSTDIYDGDGGGDRHFRFMSTVDIAKSSSTITPSYLSQLNVVGSSADDPDEAKKKYKRRSSEDMRLLLDTANALIGIDEEGRVDEWNLKAAEIARYTDDEGMGRDLVDLRLLIDADRKEAETKMARMALETRTIIDAADASIFATDKEGRVNEFNQYAAKLVGYSRDEAMGRLVSDFVSPEWRARLKGVLDDALQGRATINFEHPLDTKCGKHLDMLLSAKPRRDVNGEITGAVCVGQDVTARKKAEEGTVRMASETRRLIDTANAPIFGIDRSGRVNEWNLKAAEIVGYSSDEAMGCDLVEAFISSKYRSAVKGVLDDALQGCDTSSFEFPLFTKQGERVEVLLNATPRRDANGEITGMVGVGQDITDRKKAEAETARMTSETRFILDAANAPIFGIDVEGRINEWNKRSEELLEYTTDEVMECYALDFISPEWRESVKRVLDDALQGISTVNFEHSLATKSGGNIDLLLNTTPRRDANGEITGMVGVGQDVSDRNKAEMEKARMASDTRIILDAASVPIWAIDKEGRVNAWNKRSEELVGYTSDEAMGLLASDFAIPEWRARIQSVLEDALKGISTVNYEHPMYNQAGERLDMLLSTTPLLDASNGEITGVVGVCHDVTNRKKAEAVTAQMASEMRRLIDTANAPIFGIDKEGRVNAWNKKSAELAGYTSDEVMGRDLVQEFISPEYRVAVKEVLDNALKGLVTSSFEFPLLSKAGIPIQLLLNANPRRNDIGNIVGVVGVGQDLTEERKAMKTEVDLIKVIYRNHN